MTGWNDVRIVDTFRTRVVCCRYCDAVHGLVPVTGVRQLEIGTGISELEYFVLRCVSPFC